MTAPLADIASLGPFFAVQGHAADSEPDGLWRRMAELVERPDVLRSRVHSVRAALATAAARSPETVELRVAASVAQLGLVARLISPALALAVTSGAVPRVDLAGLWWQPKLGGAFPLSIPVDAGRQYVPSLSSVEPGQLTDLLREQVLGGPVSALVSAVLAAFSVSAQVLWGNVASAVNGAATMICTQRPDLVTGTRMIAADLLNGSPVNIDRPVVGAQFRRRSCCLIYRISAGGRAAICGDCVLAGSQAYPETS